LTIKSAAFILFSEVDSVPVLKEYAIKYGVNDKKWNLVTVTKVPVAEIISN
jgi:hypothetical protein